MSGKYERDNSYRERFIESHPPRNGKYRCVYCGKRISKDDMQVDHVIAVGRVKKNWLYRLCVPNGVNDLSNLVPSCSKCNNKKGSKGGLWAIRGHFWKIALPIYITLKTLIIFAIFSTCFILILGGMGIAPFDILLQKLESFLLFVPKALADWIFAFFQDFIKFLAERTRESFKM